MTPRLSNPAIAASRTSRVRESVAQRSVDVCDWAPTGPPVSLLVPPERLLYRAWYTSNSMQQRRRSKQAPEPPPPGHEDLRAHPVSSRGHRVIVR